MLRWRRCWAVLALAWLALASCSGQKNNPTEPTASALSANGSRENSTNATPATTPSAATNATTNLTTAAHKTTGPSAARPAPPSGTSACPASLLPYLDQQQQPAVSGVNITNSTLDGAINNAISRKQLNGPHQQPAPAFQAPPVQPAVPPWPPAAIKQGLTCTMEVSHLAAALPGSADVCNVILIKNNLMSVLYSWQLMWESATGPGLEAVAADGDVLITSSGAGPSDIVRIVNGVQSPNIDAQGGKATFVLQTAITSNSSSSNSSSNSSSVAAAKQKSHVSPAMGSVYLNGLQCTRLPLKTADPSMQYQDCAASQWELDSNGTFILPILSSLSGATSGSSSSSAPFWNGDNSRGATGNSSSATVDDDIAAALRWLSCTSHYCCGLQVVPPGSEATPPTDEPAVGALDGPTDTNTTTGNATTGNTTTAVVANMTTNITTTNSSSKQTALAMSLATAGNISNNTAPQAESVLTGQQADLQHSDHSTATIAAVVATVVAAAVLSTIGIVLLLQRRKTRQRQQQRLRLHQLMQSKDPAVPSLATAALSRGPSNASTESSGSQAVSCCSGPNSTSLVSLTSTSSWQQHSTGRPPLWIRQQPAGTWAGQATAAAGTVWRAGSWQGADTSQYLGSGPPHGLNLIRSSSSPQPFLQQQNSADQTTVNIATLEHSASLPPHHRRQLSNPSSMARAASLPPSAQQSSFHATRGPESEISPQPQPPADDVLSRSASGATSSQQSWAAAGSSAGSTWTSLRQLFSSSKPPRHSSASAASSSTLGRSSSMQAAPSAAADSSTGTAVEHTAHTQQQHIQLVQYQRQQLQLIQETAPLSSSQLPVQVQAGSAGAALRHHGSGPAGSFAGGAAAAGRALPLGISLSDAGAQAQAGLGFSGAAVGRELGLSGGVSRRISPIVSVLEDASSATSNDSFSPAAWHHTDKQLLEEQPGWLNIDFTQEVRLERKLGEGGFGQVFKARWKDDVIAVKLVPFMSLVTHHNYSVSLVSAAEPADGQQAAASGADPGGFAQPTAPSAAAELMNVGMQFSAASLRAIKQEIKVLSQLSHENIVAFKGACLAPPHICILEELADGGSLHARLYSRSSCRRLLGLAAAGSVGQPTGTGNSGKDDVSGTSGSKRPSIDGTNNPSGKGSRGSNSRGQLPPPMSLTEVLGVAIDVATAMQYLHALKPHPVVHRDLKPQNVLLDLQGRAKVCDFGISKMKDASLAASSTRLQAGTPAFMAPEQFEGRPVTDKVDVFAFGVMLWECCEQQHPWKDLTPMQIIYAVGLQKERLGRPASCLDSLWELIEACWHQQPEIRPSFNEILRRLRQIQGGLGTASCWQRQAPLMQHKPVAGQVPKVDTYLDAPCSSQESHDSSEQTTAGSSMQVLDTGYLEASPQSQPVNTAGTSPAEKGVTGNVPSSDTPAVSQDQQEDIDARVSVSC